MASTRAARPCGGAAAAAWLCPGGSGWRRLRAGAAAAMVDSDKVQVAGPGDGATSPARRVPLRWLALFGSHPAAAALRWPVLPYIDGRYVVSL